MRLKNGLFTSESVAAGHPDKVCDQISDAILDAFLARDKAARVACESFVFGSRVIVAGEFHTADRRIFDDVQNLAADIVREKLRAIGYGECDLDIDPDTCQIEVVFNHQSAEIRQGVDGREAELGAGDQGIMFGYAVNETESLMPLAWTLATDLVYAASTHVGEGILRPDGKSQVSIVYKDGKPAGIDAVVLSWQHERAVSLPLVREFLIEEVTKKTLPTDMLLPTCKFHINPAGSFTKGGPYADTGLTGRKIIVDTYGGAAPHGGGAFSGKDPSKVDRSAAYASRWVAKHIVASGLAERAIVQLSYAIGVAEPVSVAIDCGGTEIIPIDQINRQISEKYDLSPKAIIEQFGLTDCKYAPTAVLGAFGKYREAEGYAWETV